MTRRRCITCKGEKRVEGVPSSHYLHPVLAFGMDYLLPRVLLCRTCRGSGFQINEGPSWRPAPQEFIKL